MNGADDRDAVSRLAERLPNRGLRGGMGLRDQQARDHAQVIANTVVQFAQQQILLPLGGGQSDDAAA
jgi:hypothetical protein